MRPLGFSFRYHGSCSEECNVREVRRWNYQGGKSEPCVAFP